MSGLRRSGRVRRRRLLGVERGLRRFLRLRCLRPCLNIRPLMDTLHRRCRNLRSCRTSIPISLCSTFRHLHCTCPRDIPSVETRLARTVELKSKKGQCRRDLLQHQDWVRAVVYYRINEINDLRQHRTFPFLTRDDLLRLLHLQLSMSTTRHSRNLPSDRQTTK